MHKTFISYYHNDEQDLKDEITNKYGNEDFIDNSVGNGEINPYLNEDDLMRIIREEYLHDSTVTLVLVGACTASRPYVNSEIQASLRDTLYNKHNGLLAVIRDDVYNIIYTNGICKCGCKIRVPEPTRFNSYIPNLVIKNNIYEGQKCHYNDKDVYCSIIKYSTFLKDVEYYINQAYEKRDNSSMVIKKIPDEGTQKIGN